MYLCMFILRICARRRRSLNEAFLVKIANIIIIVISCPRCADSVGIRICSSGAVSSIRGKQMTPAVASERSIFSKNHDCNSYIEFSMLR